jgi:GntR family transcriptional regulator/MocR family aminotransferase
LRHDRIGIPALQAEAPDCVVYVGTASKALGPALRLGWMVVPEPLADAVRDAQHATLHNLDVPGQLGMAHYLEHHAYDQRVRAVRAEYRRRFEMLVAFIGRLSRDIPALRLGDSRAGGQALLVLPPDGPTEAELVALAADEQLGIEGLAPSSHVPGTHPPALVVGYSRPGAHRYPATLEVLQRVLSSAY